MVTGELLNYIAFTSLMVNLMFISLYMEDYILYRDLMIKIKDGKVGSNND